MKLVLKKSKLVFASAINYKELSSKETLLNKTFAAPTAPWFNNADAYSIVLFDVSEYRGKTLYFDTRVYSAVAGAACLYNANISSSSSSTIVKNAAIMSSLIPISEGTSEGTTLRYFTKYAITIPSDAVTLAVTGLSANPIKAYAVED